MGDLHLCLPQRNGTLVDQHRSPSPSQDPIPHLSDIPAESWLVAEMEAQQIIWRIQPTIVSEERRRDVIDYVQRLIKSYLGYEVFPFGSVPLKTYLPDGDIDLTALDRPNMEDKLASDVCFVLEREENNKNAEFEVKDIQYINAEVKLVKCLVQNIVVDISFNQIGGLCTLYFLEKVNHTIGKDHLFKRSIILIKAWCYYESRILGAHHALLSTYALETLVLYIFHLFHSSLDGPLAVLYKFLDYFSKFDWDNYCVSLHGPVFVSSLPEIIAESPENDGGVLLLTKEFLNECGNMFSVPPRTPESNHRLFVKKHLNIVDPLKENNNLGRSVSKGNSHRIRSAFTYGARKLGRILLHPRKTMIGELANFFKNTLERHGNGERPDVHDIHSVHPDRISFNLNDVSNAMAYICNKNEAGDTTAISLPSEGSAGELYKKFNDVRFLGSRNVYGQGMDLESHPSNHLHGRVKLDNGGFTGSNAVYYTHSMDSGKDLATCRSLGDPIINGNHNHSHSSTETSKWNECNHDSPQLLSRENGRIMKEDSYQSLKGLTSQMFVNDHNPQLHLHELDSSNSRTSLPCTSNHMTSASVISNGGPKIHGTSISSTDSERDESISDVGHNHQLHFSAGVPDVHDLADLSGDLGAHFFNLSCAQYFSGNFIGGPMAPRNQSSQFQNHAWDVLHYRNMFPPMNGVIPGPPVLYDSNHRHRHHNKINIGLNGPEDSAKPRGTGTYFPNTNSRPYRDRQSQMRRNSPVTYGVSRYRNNGQAMTPPGSKSADADRGGNGPEPLAQPPDSSIINAHGKSGHLDSSQTSSPGQMTSQSIACASSSQCQLEFGSLGPFPLGSFNSELSKTIEPNGARSYSSASMYSSVVQYPQINPCQERLTQSFQLKDDGDFPPLSGRGQPNGPVHINQHKSVWDVRREMDRR